MKRTVVILLSDKRSGSTMFQTALCRHSMIQTVDYSPHTYLETHHWLKGAVMLHPDEKIYSGYGSAKNARSYMLDLLSKNLGFEEVKNRLLRVESTTSSPALDPRPSTLDHSLIFQGWEALCEKFAQPVFFEKSPQYIGCKESLDLIRQWMHQTTYQVKIIGLTRNPLSVQYSAWKLFHTPPKKRQFGWIQGQQNLLDFTKALPPETYLHVKYENLIAQPEAAFTKICDFIGLNYEMGITEKLHDQSLTKWKDDPYFTLRLDEKVKAVARQFGYADEELDNPEKPEPPICWKLRKKAEATYKLARARLQDRILKPIYLRIKGNNA